MLLEEQRLEVSVAVAGAVAGEYVAYAEAETVAVGASRVQD